MKTILVVDDEDNIRRMVKELLRQEGYQALSASSGKEALATLKKKKVDLVLLDFFMPEMSGREVAEQMRADSATKNTKIAFLTVAEFGKSGMDRLKALGSIDYIRKPFDNNDLIKRINKILR
jgi:CheY-like chemotaxis protein